MREKLGLLQKDVAAGIGSSQDQYSRKSRGQVTFTLEEIGAICEFFHAPAGWPFIDEDSARLLEAVKVFLANAAPPPRGN